MAGRRYHRLSMKRTAAALLLWDALGARAESAQTTQPTETKVADITSTTVSGSSTITGMHSCNALGYCARWQTSNSYRNLYTDLYRPQRRHTTYYRGHHRNNDRLDWTDSRHSDSCRRRCRRGRCFSSMALQACAWCATCTDAATSVQNCVANQ